VKNLKIRWRLHGDEVEPTTRQRGINVYRELQRQGYDADKWEVGEPADIIVLQYGMRLLDEALSTGATVVTDINDQLFAPHHPYYKETMAGFQKVHAVVAGSPRLAQHLRRLHPFVRMIEEAVDRRYFEVERKQHKGINIVWMGMHDNIVYFDEIDRVLAKLAAEYHFTVHFVCPPIDGFRRSNEAKVNAKPYSGQFHAWTMDTLLEQMALADIAVTPLFQQEWTWCKCANKMLSFMATGLPVVAPDVPSYRAVSQHGSDSFLAYTDDEWYDALSSLLRDAKLRQRVGTSARLKAMHYSIEGIGGEWLNLFTEVRPK